MPSLKIGESSSRVRLNEGYDVSASKVKVHFPDNASQQDIKTRMDGDGARPAGGAGEAARTTGVRAPALRRFA